MDDVVAVEVTLADGGLRYFVTWGRIQQTVDPEPVCKLVLQFSRSCHLGGVPVSARVCNTLREAAESPDAPYFYECFLTYCRAPRPSGAEYEAWRATIDKAMRSGAEISYCGRPPART